MRVASLLVVLCLQLVQARAQEKIAEYTGKNLYPYSFDGWVDKEGYPVIHYIKRTSVAPKVYQSYFVFLRGAKTNQLELPFAVTVQAIGFTNSGLVICVMKRNEARQVKQPNVTLLVTDKSGSQLLRNVDIDLRGEKDPFFFSDKGIIYSISFVKKSQSIRIRRIVGLDVELFEYPANSGEESVLSGELAFCPDDQETDYIGPNSRAKLFFHDGKLYVADMKRAQGEGMILYAFSLSKPEALQVHRGNQTVTERSQYFPFQDKIFLYESTKNSAEIKVLDVPSLNTLRTFSTNGLEGQLPESECMRTKGVGRLYEQEMDECTPSVKAKILGSNKPWFQIWRTNDTSLRMTYGNYLFASEDHLIYTYMMAWIDPRTLGFIDAPGSSSGVRLRNFAYVDRKGGQGEYTLCYGPGVTYLIGYDNKTTTFTIWK